MNPWSEILKSQGGFETKQQDNPWLTVMRESQKITRLEEEEERKRRAEQQARENEARNKFQDQQRIEKLKKQQEDKSLPERIGETIARTLPGGMADLEAEQKAEEMRGRQATKIAKQAKSPDLTEEQRQRLTGLVNDLLADKSGSAIIAKDLQNTGEQIEQSVSAVGDAVTRAPRIIGEGVARTLPGGLADLETEEKVDRVKESDVLKLSDMIRNPNTSPEQKAELKKQMSSLVKERGGLSSVLLDIKDDTNIRKFLAAAGEVGLTAATLGTGKAAIQGAKMGAKELAKRTAVTSAIGAAEGATYGALSELQQNKAPNGDDLLRASAIGAAFGGAIGGAVPLVGGLVNSVKNRPNVLDKQVVNEPGKLNKGIIQKIDNKVSRGLDNIMEPILASTPGARTKELFGKARVALVRSDEPILRQLRAGERKGSLDEGTTRRIETLMRDVKTADQQAEYYMRGNQNWTNVIQGLGNKDLKNMSKYAEARAELDLINRGIKPDAGRSAEFQKILEQAPPEFSQRYDSLVKYYDDLRERLVDAGIVSREQADEWATTDPNYIHIQRELDNISDIPRQGMGGAGSFKVSKTDLKRGESVAEVKDLLQTAISRTSHLEREILRNQAANEVVDGLMRANPGLLMKVEGDTKIGSRPTIARRVNGQQETYITTPEIEAAAKSWGRVPLNAFMRVMASPTRLLQSTLTGPLNPAFVLKSTIRDPMESFVLSRNSLATHNPANVVGSLADAAGKSDLFKEFMRTEGSNTLIDTFRNVQNTARTLREQARLTKPKVQRQAEVITNPKEWWRRWEDVSRFQEQIGRYQNFRGAYNDAIKKGASQEQALIEARWAARNNMTDFFQTGDYSQIANAFFPYFNATVQGGMRLARSFREKPVSTSAKVVAAVQIPTALSTMYNLSDPRRAEIYADIPDYEKENNWIFILPGSEKTNGRWGVIKVPKPPGVGAFSNPVEKMVASIYGKDPVQFGDFVKAVAKGFGSPVDVSSVGSAVGSVIPQQIKPFVQAQANKDFFTGRDIVPKWIKEQESEPYKQHYDDTPDMYKAIGRMIGVSPLIIEQAGKDVLGEASRAISGSRTPTEYLSQSVSSAAGGVKQRELSEAFSSVVSQRSATSSRITEAVKAGDLDAADRIARDFNARIANLEQMTKQKYVRLTEKQKKLLKTMRVPMDGDKLSQGSINSRLSR